MGKGHCDFSVAEEWKCVRTSQKRQKGHKIKENDIRDIVREPKANNEVKTHYRLHTALSTQRGRTYAGAMLFPGVPSVPMDTD